MGHSFVFRCFLIFTCSNFGVETAKDLGFLYPDLCSTDALQSGQIGFIVVGAKVCGVWWGVGGGSSQFDIFSVGIKSQLFIGSMGTDMFTYELTVDFYGKWSVNLCLSLFCDFLRIWSHGIHHH